MAKVFRVWSENGRVEGPARSGDAQGDLSAEFAGGRYELQSRLGGGHGTDVYRAMDQLLRRPVALKVYRAGAGPQADGVFREEAQRLAWLEHANLVTLFDAGIDDGRPYLVLQYVDGVSLANRLGQGALSLDQTIAVAGRLADVLAYVHERGIVHRDVRPGSVLVDERDVYLADFGISRTRGGIGRPDSGYLAPEQLQRRPVGPAADVYSLGLVLLECLTGEPPYPSSTLATAVARLTRPPVIPDGLPEPLRDALEAMTAEHPSARPTAEECRAAFALCAPLAPDAHPEFADELALADAYDGYADNVYEFDAARRRRASGAFDRTEFGAGAFRPDAVESGDEDTQPLPLVDLTPLADELPAAGRRHRADPGRRRRWLRLAATGAVGVALAGGAMAVAEPRDTNVRRVAAPPQAVPAPPEAAEPPVQRQDVEQEPPRIARQRSVRSSAVRPVPPVAPTSAAPPAPSPSPDPSPTPCVPGLIDDLLEVVAPPASGEGAVGEETAAPTPSPSPTEVGATADPEPEPPCAA